MPVDELFHEDPGPRPAEARVPSGAARGKIVTMSDVPPTTSAARRARRERRLWSSGARCSRGALVGLGLLVALSVVAAILDHYLDDFDDSGWIYPLFVGVLVSYAVGGLRRGARALPTARSPTGRSPALGAFVLWIPVRIVIWVVRDEDKGLFSGHSAVLRPGQIFGHIVIASALGMFGGWLGARRRALDERRERRHRVVTWPPVASRPGGRVPGCEAPVRGTSGLHRARCWVTPSRGDPQDSATESRPPMAPVRRCTGKGETVR